MKLIQLLQPVVLAVLGATAGHYLNLPLGELLGAAIMILLACKIGMNLEVDDRFIIFIQLVLGIGVGCQINLGLVDSISNFWLLAGLLLCMFSQLFVGYAWLRYTEKWNKSESLLGAVPGAMAAVLTVTSGKDSASPRVIFTHMVRTFALIGLATWISGGQQVNALSHEVYTSTLLWLVPIALVALLLGRFLDKSGMPAPYLITGLIVTALSKVSVPTLDVKMPDELTILAMIMLGALIGVRLKDMTAKEVAQNAKAALIVTMLTFAITVILAVIFSTLTSMEFNILLISWVPGGVELMTSIALLMGLEPAFVMINHVTRMTILHAAPMFMKKDWFEGEPSSQEQLDKNT